MLVLTLCQTGVDIDHRFAAPHSDAVQMLTRNMERPAWINPA